MTSVFQPPPTWAMPEDPGRKNAFNPVWLNWFVLVAKELSNPTPGPVGPEGPPGPPGPAAPVGPACSAYRTTSDQGVTSGSLTKVQLNAENFDTGGCFDSTTDYRFTPNVAGYYQVSFGVHVGASSGLTIVQGRIYKNGSGINIGSYVTGSASTDAISVGSILVYMNGTTDYLELWVYVNGASPYVRASSSTVFSAFLALAS